MSGLQPVLPPAPPEPAPGQAPIYYTLPAAPPPARASLAQGLIAALLLTIVLLLLALAAGSLLLVATLSGWGGRTVGDAGQRAAETVRSAGDALGRAGQEARDRLDPSHPPREALLYDPEIDDFLKLNVGQPLPGGRDRAFTLAAIRSRDGETRPELARYAVVHGELRQPNETKVLGVTVRRDAEPRDDYLYQGEAFRLGGQVYKVNWISPERQQIALLKLRIPDRANLPLKFVYD